jgi:DNA-binding response OmpR family regulator
MRILLVEDEIRLAENVAHALRDGPDFTVDHAEGGQTASDLAENLCYDLIILDFILPKLDGLTGHRRFRQRGDGTPVLILTARSERTSIIQLLNCGADGYPSKPFDLGEVIARAKALTRRGKCMASPALDGDEPA